MSSISEAVNKALTDNTETEEENLPTPEVEEEETEEMEESEEDEEDEKSEEEETSTEDAETQAARNLFRRLNDPKTAKSTLQELQNLIFGSTPPETKSEAVKQTTAVKKALEEIFQEAFGEEAALLPRNFAQTMEKVLADYVEERLSPLQNELNNFRLSAAQKQVQSVMERAEKEIPGYSENLPDIEATIKEMPYSGDGSAESQFRYLRKITAAVLAEKNPKTKSIEEIRKERIEQNRKGFTQPKSSGNSGAKKSIARPTIDQAIAMALESTKGKG